MSMSGRSRLRRWTNRSKCSPASTGSTTDSPSRCAANLRIPEDEARREARRQYVDDFRIVARALADGEGPRPLEGGGE